MNILYVHGFGSRYDPTNAKVLELTKLGTVHGIDIDWTETPWAIINDLVGEIREKEIDLIVGTSMGGWGAWWAGATVGIPFVAINPAIEPSTSLQRHIGAGTDYEGRSFILTPETVEQYNALEMPLQGCGLILVDLGDQLLNAQSTINKYSEYYRCVSFAGGNHRFVHMHESIEIISNFYFDAGVVYGAEF